jgi:hypothetical protein
VGVNDLTVLVLSAQAHDWHGGGVLTGGQFLVSSFNDRQWYLYIYHRFAAHRIYYLVASRARDLLAVWVGKPV